MKTFKKGECSIEGCNFAALSRGYCKDHSIEFPAYPKNTQCSYVGCKVMFYKGSKPRIYCDKHLSYTSCSPTHTSLKHPPLSEGVLPVPGKALAALVFRSKIKQRRAKRLKEKGLSVPIWC